MCTAMNPKIPLMAVASDNNCVKVEAAIGRYA